MDSGVNPESLSYSDFLEQMCPIYLSYGMNYEQYWFGDPKIAIYYRKAHEIETRKRNSILHMQGNYIYESVKRGVADCFNKEPIGWLEEPFPLTREEAEEQVKRHKRKKMQKLKNKFFNRGKQINATRKEGE